MKLYRYLLMMFAFVIGVTSCEIVSEDAFSKKPVAPEFYQSSEIIMTANTMSDNVNFSWKEARFAGNELTYNLYAYYGGDSVSLDNTPLTYYKTTKEIFKDAIYKGLTLPINNSFRLSFKVFTEGVDVDGFPVKLVSREQFVEVYAYGDAVPAVPSSDSTKIVLDKFDPLGVVSLLKWEKARLVYGEDVYYSVKATISENVTVEQAATKDTVVLSSEIKNTSYQITIDQLNEAVVSLGAKEDATTNIDFLLYSHCESIPNGVPSASFMLPVTTYLATFPELLYMPGSHQGWDPASAPTLKQNTLFKGVYEGVVDLRTKDGSNVQFKFSPNPRWEGDFGGQVELSKFGADYNAARGSVGSKDNIEIPSGIYNVFLNKKYNTVEFVQIDKLCLTGDAVGGWGDGFDFEMEYDPIAQKFTTTAQLETQKSLKIRLNHDWTYSYGGQVDNISLHMGDNISFTGESGEYRIVLDVSTVPYTISFSSTSYPEYLYVAGNHQGWNPAAAPLLYGDSKGKYEGFVNLDGAFKFCSKPSWEGPNYGGALDNFDSDPGAGNLDLPKGLYILQVDLNENKCTAHLLISRVAAVGSFCGWGTPSDEEMIFNAETKMWEGTFDFPKDTEFKFRMNGNWSLPNAFNIGGDLNSLSYDGGNFKVAEAGTYKVTLHILSKPWKATYTKQ